MKTMKSGVDQNKLIFVAIVPVVVILFVILYLFKVNQFNFLDHPVLTKTLQIFKNLIPSRHFPEGN